jgi:hypothetical protein
MKEDFKEANKPDYVLRAIHCFSGEEVIKLKGEAVFAFQRCHLIDAPSRLETDPPQYIRTTFTAGKGASYIDYVPESQMPGYATELESMGYTKAFDALEPLVKQVKELQKGLGDQFGSVLLKIPYEEVTEERRKEIANRMANKLIAMVSGPSFFRR